MSDARSSNCSNSSKGKAKGERLKGDEITQNVSKCTKRIETAKQNPIDFN